MSTCNKSAKTGDGRTVFLVCLDRLTEERLLAISIHGQAAPAMLIASIIHDVLEDDAVTHSGCDHHEHGDNHG